MIRWLADRLLRGRTTRALAATRLAAARVVHGETRDEQAWDAWNLRRTQRNYRPYDAQTLHLPSLPDLVGGAADPDCRICGGAAWVCENHPDRVWDGVSSHPDACGCGAGQPCACTEL